MNILFITNLYPPHHLGGYELRCHDVVTKLEKRGHRVTVLTSMYGVEHPVIENGVHRVLTLESDIYHYQAASLLRLRGDHKRNLNHVRQTIADFQPDVIFIWGMWNLSKLLAQEAERQAGSRVVYSIADMWPTHTDAHTRYWQTPARRWFMRLPKRILATLIRPYLRLEGLPATLRWENVICVSRALRLAVERIDVTAGQVYNIGGGPANTISVWAEFGPLLAELLGHWVPVTYNDWRPGDQPVYVSDTSKVREELGWQPTVDKEEGVQRLYEWVVRKRRLFA